MRRMIAILQPVLSIAIFVACVTAFSPQSPDANRNHLKSLRLSNQISIDESAPRDVDGLQYWAAENGVFRENGFEIYQLEDGSFGAMTSTGGQKGGRLLGVPEFMHITSKKVFEESRDVVAPALQVLNDKGVGHLIPQFLVFVKILKEYYKGDQSDYFPWMMSLPRSFNTAVTFDDLEMACLPPFVSSLAKIDRIQCQVFGEAVQAINTPLLPNEVKTNMNILIWAYNVVFTRCWINPTGECDIIPMADMFNHHHHG